MLDPWAEDGPKSSARISTRPQGLVKRIEFDDDEVVTSAKPVAPRQAAALPSRRPDAHHPLPPAPPPASPPPPPVPQAPSSDPASIPPAPPTLTDLSAPGDHYPESERFPAARELPDLSAVEAFADLPDDVRHTFALAAAVRKLARGEEITSFAIALVTDGTANVLAVGVDAAALRLPSGTVLRSRGTLATRIPLRVVCSSERATVLTWDDGDVTSAFGPCPWVDEDLCAAGDHVQALAGLSLGPLGQPAYEQVRALLAERLTLRALAAGEPIVREAEPVHGLFVVAGGDVELSGVQGGSTFLDAGSFVFPTETLSMGRAPSTARAGKAGALVLHADRSTTQELVVTQPLLLELLSSG
jgi:hypothetical protein